jgi:hypothetical protein
VFYYISYHLIGVPAYWLGLVLMVSMRVGYAGLGKVYEMVRKLVKFDVPKDDGYDLVNLYYSG